MKKTVSMLIALILFLGVLPVNFAQIAQAAAPGTYNTGDIAVINRLITNNGLEWPKAPKDGSSVPEEWRYVSWSEDSKNKRVKSLNFGYCSMSGKVDLNGLDSLKKLNCDWNHFITALGLSNNSELKYLDCRGNNLTTLNVKNNTKLETLGCANNELTALDLSKNTRLKELDCSENRLTKLDVSKNKLLKTLNCGHNELTKLDVSKNVKLTELIVGNYYKNEFWWIDDFDDFEDYSNNKITSLDVSKNTALKGLYCQSMELAALNVSKNTALESLNCSWNKLTALNVSKNTKLEWMNCGWNKLTSLNLSNNKKIKNVNCRSNKLTKLDVSKNPALKSLDCYTNKLTKLNISKNTKLESLWCGENKLTKLDVSKNTKLDGMNCSDNKLTKLNVSKNTRLESLYCYDNKLTNLNISKNTKLIDLICSNNKLTRLSISKNKNLGYLDCRYNYFSSVSAVPGGKNVGGGSAWNFKFNPQRSSKVTGKSVKLSVSSKKLTAGGTAYLTAKVSSTNNTKVKWKSSNDKVAKVNSNGKITAKYPGKATITVTTKKDGKKATCAITVKPKKPEQVNVRAVSNARAEVSWKKVSGVTGYQIVRATSKNGTYKSVGATHNLTFKDTKITQGKTYYYKVRAYKNVSGKKIYGAYSSVKSVRV